jgi:Apea-like HEPN
VRTKNPNQERALIARRDPKRPYGSKVTFQILNSHTIGELENVTVLLDSGAIATIQPARSPSWEGGRRFLIKLEGFPTASIAETEGLRFAQALLLSAISLNFGLRLLYHGREPALVYERLRSEGATAWGEGVVGWSAATVLTELAGTFRCNLLDRRLILSMELYCAALLESNERTRFVIAVSALEPLAQQQSLGLAVSAYVDNALAILNSATDIDQRVRASLCGRINQLRQESVRQAIFRLADTWFPSCTEIRERIDRAYRLRSELLHEGSFADPDIDLTAEMNKIATVLRTLYERASGRPLRASFVA